MQQRRDLRSTAQRRTGRKLAPNALATTGLSARAWVAEDVSKVIQGMLFLREAMAPWKTEKGAEEGG